MDLGVRIKEYLCLAKAKIVLLTDDYSDIIEQGLCECEEYDDLIFSSSELLMSIYFVEKYDYNLETTHYTPNYLDSLWFGLSDEDKMDRLNDFFSVFEARYNLLGVVPYEFPGYSFKSEKVIYRNDIIQYINHDDDTVTIAISPEFSGCCNEGSGSSFPEAPLDWNPYIRQSGSWVNGLLRFYPLNTNPSGYLTSSSLVDYYTSSEIDDIVATIEGSPGPTGPQGVPGNIGPAGAQGPIGITGPQGIPGPAGVQGPAGVEGPIGPQGAQGIQGPIGPTGVAGPSGPAGSQGLSGAQGEKGDQGIQGIQGVQGEAGLNGSDGATGPIGPQGEPGPVGATGDQGLTGNTGYQGIPGTTGPQGLKGDQGPQGPQGIQGIQGPIGETGTIDFWTGDLRYLRKDVNDASLFKLTLAELNLPDLLANETPDFILAVMADGTVKKTTLSSVVDKNYVHLQASAIPIWTITHNLNKKPSITIIDSAGSQILAKIVYVDLNNVTIDFNSVNTSGEAIFN